MPRENDPAPSEGTAGDPKPQNAARKPYVKPRIEDTEPLENVTLLSGGVNPTTANPFVQ